MSKTTVEQLIIDIDRRYPNTYTVADKIDWINESLKEVYKDLALDEFYSFDTIEGENIYNLPTDCTIDMIKSVEISVDVASKIPRQFKTLKYCLDNETIIENSYHAGVDEGQIGIYPIPDAVYRVNIYYKKAPVFITKAEDYIEIDDRYTNLIKYSVLATICMSGHNPDAEMANQYILLYNNLVREIMQNKYEDRQKYYIVRDELPMKVKRRRRIL